MKDLASRSILSALLVLSACASKRPVELSRTGSLSGPLESVVADMVKNRDRLPSGKIVVYAFTDLDGRQTPQGRLVAERLTTALARTGKFDVIERSRLEAAMKELNLQASGVTGEKDVIRTGRMLGADAAVTGTVASMTGGYEVNARTINVGSGEIITGAIVTLAGSDLPAKEPPPQAGNYNSPDQFAVSDRIREQVLPVPTAVTNTVPPGWKVWPGWGGSYGRSVFANGHLYYYMASRQSGGLSEPKNGYYPGLILEKRISGADWTIDLKPSFHMGSGLGRWFTVSLWLGPEGVRPSNSNPGFDLLLTVLRMADPGYGTGGFAVSCCLDGDDSGKMHDIGGGVTGIRFKRSGSRFSVLADYGDGKYKEVYSIVSEKSAQAETQRLILSGQSYTTSDAYADYPSIMMNGRSLF